MPNPITIYGVFLTWLAVALLQADAAITDLIAGSGAPTSHLFAAVGFLSVACVWLLVGRKLRNKPPPDRSNKPAKAHPPD